MRRCCRLADYKDCNCVADSLFLPFLLFLGKKQRIGKQQLAADSRMEKQQIHCKCKFNFEVSIQCPYGGPACVRSNRVLLQCVFLIPSAQISQPSFSRLKYIVRYTLYTLQKSELRVGYFGNFGNCFFTPSVHTPESRHGLVLPHCILWSTPPGMNVCSMAPTLFFFSL